MMNWRKNLILNVLPVFISVFVTSSALADPKSIDEFHANCLDRSGGVTAAMLKCISQTQALWEQEMTENYRKLRFLLPPKKQIALRDAQREWIIFRDQELKNISEFYSDIDGTMYLVTAAEDRMALTESRAKDLRRFLIILDAEK